MVSILDHVAIVPSVSVYRLSVLDAIGGCGVDYPGGAADTAVTVEVALRTAAGLPSRVEARVSRYPASSSLPAREGVLRSLAEQLPRASLAFS